jgi:hypothetical protein
VTDNGKINASRRGAAHWIAAVEVEMTAAFHGSRFGTGLARGAPLAKAGVAAGVGKAVLIGVPAVLIGVGIGYGLLKAFNVRWDEFSRRAADGEPTMMRPSR